MKFPYKVPVMRCFGIFFIVNLNDLLNKQSNCLWFDTLIWYHCNFVYVFHIMQIWNVVRHILFPPELDVIHAVQWENEPIPQK